MADSDGSMRIDLMEISCNLLLRVECSPEYSTKFVRLETFRGIPFVIVYALRYCRSFMVRKLGVTDDRNSLFVLEISDGTLCSWETLILDLYEYTE